MAGSRKRGSADANRGSAPRRALLAAARRVLSQAELRGLRLAVGLSGGVDSVVLLHAMHVLAPEFGYHLRAAHVDHGISPNAAEWRRFCTVLCRRWKIACSTRRVAVRPTGQGPEAAAREARYAALGELAVDVLVLGHHLNDQAETVLLNLLRGAGLRGASGMPAVATWRAGQGPHLVLRPLLAVPRETIVAYARGEGLEWIDDESNGDADLTRNYMRWVVAPRLAQRFPRWRESLARAAQHFAEAEALLRPEVRASTRLRVERLQCVGPARARLLLREFLAAHHLRPPSTAKLGEMLRQIIRATPDARVAFAHDGAVLRVYRGQLLLTLGRVGEFAPIRWEGELRVPVAAFAGELWFHTVRGAGIDAARLAQATVTIRARSGGERLQPDARRPRRSLKNLFQEAGVPPWERDAMPLLYCEETLVWVPGLGVDASFRAGSRGAGVLPEWRRIRPAALDVRC